MIKISIRKKLHMAGGKGELVINTELAPHLCTALYGPSGAGKTSLLRILAGLMQPEEGYVEVNGQVWLDTRRNINLPPQKRSIGFLFQDYALFPNMTVLENLLYALPNSAPKAQANSWLNKMGLAELAQQKPNALSGGQKQRVALARALLRQPQLLLLDEPLSALDHITRVALQNELLAVHQQYRTSTILVSHDVTEVYKLASQVIELKQGQMQQIGSPAEVFGLPTHQNGVLIFGEVIQADTQSIIVHTSSGMVKIQPSNKTAHLTAGDKVTIHATDLSLQKLS